MSTLNVKLKSMSIRRFTKNAISPNAADFVVVTAPEAIGRSRRLVPPTDVLHNRAGFGSRRDAGAAGLPVGDALPSTAGTAVPTAADGDTAVGQSDIDLDGHAQDVDMDGNDSGTDSEPPVDGAPALARAYSLSDV